MNRYWRIKKGTMTITRDSNGRKEHQHSGMREPEGRETGWLPSTSCRLRDPKMLELRPLRRDAAQVHLASWEVAGDML